MYVMTWKSKFPITNAIVAPRHQPGHIIIEIFGGLKNYVNFKIGGLKS
jgi:hypothetical protein